MRVWLALIFPCLSWSLAVLAGSHIPTAAETKELLAAVCPGSSRFGKGSASCETCPSFVKSGWDERFGLRSVVYGKFLDTHTPNAVLDFDGCEPHANNFGGSVILRWKGLTRWEFVRYEPGSRTSDCQKITAGDGHDLLLCRVGWMGQGYTVDGLSLLDLRGKANWKPLLSLNANTGTCDNDLYQIEIVSWELRSQRLRVQAAATQWRRSGEGCQEAKPPLGATRRYTLEYRFDGSRFVPTAQTARLAKTLEAIGP